MTESPLLPFVDTPVDVARFAIEPVGLEDQLPQVDELLAGAAEVDITPPPGMPKAGFSKNAHDGEGFRTRPPSRRVLHLRGGRTSLALVQLDLLSGSSLLQHLVARAVAGRTDVRLPGLFVGATHTHAGPGQFDASPFYNRFASNRPGFDPAWTNWLAERIAGAVVSAVESRRPASLGCRPHRGLGTHPQPVPGPPHAQHHRAGQAARGPAKVRRGQPLAPPRARRCPRRGRWPRTVGRDGRVLYPRHGHQPPLPRLSRRRLGLPRR